MEQDDEIKYYIELFGRTRNEQSVYLRVTDYKPFFYIEIPEKWTTGHIDKFINELRNRAGKLSSELINHDIVKKHKFKEFNNYQKFKFLQLEFKTINAMRIFKSILTRGIKTSFQTKLIKLNQYESNLDPILRCMHIRNLNSAGWVQVNKYRTLYKNISCSEINIETSWTNLNPIHDKSISKLIIMSYDIECASEDGSFPKASRDPIIMIGSTVSKYGETSCYYKNIITLGTCTEVQDCDVVETTTETELLMAWNKLVRKINPDILVTYNGFGFDNEYLYARCQALKIQKDFMKLARVSNITCEFKTQTLVSSALGENILKYPTCEGRVQIDLLKLVQQIAKLDSYSLDSVASTYIRENILEIKDKNVIITRNSYGLDIDRYIAIKSHDGLSENQYGNTEKFKVINIIDNKENNNKEIYVDRNIDVNKLDFKNTRVFWCQTKDDIKPSDIFACYNGTPEMRSNIAKYCIQDCVLLNILMSKLNVINNYIGMANVCHVPFSYIFLRGQGIKIFSLVAEQCRKRDHLIPLNKKTQEIVANYYDIETSEKALITEQILNAENRDDQLLIFTTKSKLLKIGKNIDIHAIPKHNSDSEHRNDAVKINKNILQIIKKTQKTFLINEYIELDFQNWKYYWVYQDSSYEGATVFEPNTGIHKQPVVVLDYKSLYPSSMIMNNMSPECCIADDIDMSQYPDYEVNQIEAKMGIEMTKTIKFVKHSDPAKIGILPEILIGLLQARSNTRKLQAAETDPFLRDVYEGLQLAYKIVANSLYGQTGSEVSAIYKKEIAAATTATGRDMLNFAKNFVEDKIELISNVFKNPDHTKTDFYNVMNVIFNSCNHARFRNYFNNFIGAQTQESIGDILKYKNLLGLHKTHDLEKLLSQIKRKTYDVCDIQPIFYDTVYDKFKHILDDFQISLGPKTIYGDSVTHDTPILLKDNNNNIQIKMIQDIGTNWRPYHMFKSEDPDLICKQMDSNISYKVWTSRGWSQIRRVIRHKTHKKIYEVLTHTGYVRVTEDHSLLRSNGQIIKPYECNVGTELMHGFPIFEHKISNNFSENKAYIYGLFLSDGNKNIPTDILNGSLQDKQNFLKGYSDANDCHRKNIRACDCHYIDVKSMTNAMQMFYLIKSIGYNVYVNTILDKPEIFRLEYSHNSYIKQPYNIKQIKEIKEIKKEINIVSDYVYDLETETGNFHAGVGELIVKNTDSIFFIPHFRNLHTGQIMVCKTALHKAIMLGELISHMTFMALKEPMELEYEKTFWPLCLLKKKKYVGNKYETNPNKYYQASMGIVLKRRDNAPIVKIVCGGIVRELLNNTAEMAVNYTKKILNDIINNKISLERFIITKTLRDTYKDRTKLAHAVLADRIAARTGNHISSNTRISFVYVINDNMKIDFNKYATKIVTKKKHKNILQGDLIEDPDYIIEHNLKPDSLFYITNQIMKPAIQFLELAIEHPEAIFNHYINREIQKRKGKSSILSYDIFN